MFVTTAELRFGRGKSDLHRGEGSSALHQATDLL